MAINVYQLVSDGTFKEAFQTGSRYICNPAPTDTDDDYMCLVEDIFATHRYLTEKGCTLGGSMSPVETSTDHVPEDSDFSIFDADLSDFSIS